MILSLIKKFGLTKFIIGITVIVAALSVIVTAILLSIFQGYIDALGIVISIGVPAILLPIPAVCCFRAMLMLDIAESKLNKKNDELEKVIVQIKKLEGMLPICADCKKIRDSGGSWKEVEVYIRNSSEAEFSHSLCPDCTKKLYSEYLP